MNEFRGAGRLHDLDNMYSLMLANLLLIFSSLFLRSVT